MVKSRRTIIEIKELENVQFVGVHKLMDIGN